MLTKKLGSARRMNGREAKQFNLAQKTLVVAMVFYNE